MIIRPAVPADMASIERLCVAELDLEPDAAELPGIATQAPGSHGLIAQDGEQVVGACFGGLARVPAAPAAAATAATPGAAGTRGGHIELLAVARAAHRTGTGRQLLSRMEDLLRERGARVIYLRGNPPGYLWPGIDPRYTAMTLLAERAGYQQYREAVDMAVELDNADLDTATAERDLAAAGLEVRPAAHTEAEPVRAWLLAGPWGGSGWPDETAAALTWRPGGCQVACRDGRYVGFACHGSSRRGWFGPMGVLESEREHGLGSVLLKRCLTDMRNGGHQTARIGWVGPVRFYARTLGARIERVYWMYRKEIT